MKTLSEFKRKVQKGATMTLTFFGGNQHKYLNTPRIVNKVTSTGFELAVMEGGKVKSVSELNWPTAKEVSFPEDDDSIVTIKFKEGLTMVYKIEGTYP